MNHGASFTELGVERLAAQAGISRSTFYVHFQDKGDLARKLTRTVLIELREVSRRWWEVAEHAVRADLETSITAIVDVYRRHAAAFTAVVETATYDTSVTEELRVLVQEIIDATRTAIERGQAAGPCATSHQPKPPLYSPGWSNEPATNWSAGPTRTTTRRSSRYSPTSSGPRCTACHDSYC